MNILPCEATQHRSHSCRDFARARRCRYVVVRSRFQSENPFFLRSVRRKKDHRRQAKRVDPSDSAAQVQRPCPRHRRFDDDQRGVEFLYLTKHVDADRDRTYPKALVPQVVQSKSSGTRFALPNAEQGDAYPRVQEVLPGIDGFFSVFSVFRQMHGHQPRRRSSARNLTFNVCSVPAAKLATQKTRAIPGTELRHHEKP